MSSRWIPRIPGAGIPGPPGPPTPPGQDKFAPKYLVGNVLAGDPAVSTPGPFVYIADPGDGSGIEAALALAAVTPGDLWIRPGTYDLGVGAVVTPLVVPANTRVQGAGRGTTIITGRASGNQGVFSLDDGASLRDMSINVEASATSIGADAVIDCSTSDGGNVLRDLSVVFGTDPLGQLREGIRLSGTQDSFGASDVLNVLVQAETTTGALSPTIGWRLLQGSIIAARDIQSFGGDIGLESSGGAFLCESFFCVGWSIFGIRHDGMDNGEGAIRLLNGIIFADDASVGGICIQLGGGAHVVRSSFLQNTVTAGTHGVWVHEDNQQIAFPEMEDLLIIGCEYGIRLGDGANESTVFTATVADSFILGFRNGILVESGAQSQSALCHIYGNDIITEFQDPIVPIGILLTGNQHEVTGNNVFVTANATVAAKGIECAAPKTKVAENSISFSGLYGIHMIGERCVIVGNEVEAGDIPVGGACVRIEGVRSTLSGGTNTQGINPYVGPAVLIVGNQIATTGVTTFVISAPPALTQGIGVSGNNNTVIGCVCEGSATGAVLDTGVGNDIAHNIGA